jgi:D-alanine-D-alanine ligase
VSPERPTVAIVYNEPVLPPDHPDAVSEADVVAVAQGVAEVLSGQGFKPRLLAAGPPLSGFLERFTGMCPDVVFNLLEGFGGHSDGEAHLTSLFELLGVPCTGSPAATLGLCIVKSRTNALLRGWGLPTAAALTVAPGEPIPEWPHGGRVIVKPDAEDASLGIHQLSVVERRDEIVDRVERLWRDYGGSVLIEAYLPGPEFNVTVLALPEAQALPLSQVVYDSKSVLLPIMTYAAKWDPTSRDDLSSTILCPAPIAPELTAEIGSVAERAFRVTGCRDYARVDIRLDHEGRPMILEVNSNPDISPGAGLARSVRVSGRDYEGTLAAITRQALERGTRGR